MTLHGVLVGKTKGTVCVKNETIHNGPSLVPPFICLPNLGVINRTQRCMDTRRETRFKTPSNPALKSIK
jgi:hypothetical protein